jgi:hypothetical protein
MLLLFRYSATRESWIRAKYVNLSFVKNIVDASAAVGHDAAPSPLKTGRRWSVRRARRRYNAFS